MSRKDAWSRFDIKRKRNLTPARIESATVWYEEQDAKFNNKQDTLALIHEPLEDVVDMFDNNLDSGWPYND